MTRQSAKGKVQQERSKSDRTGRTLVTLKPETSEKRGKTKQSSNRSDKDQRGQSTNTSESSKTDSAGTKLASIKSQLHEENKEGNQDTSPVNADDQIGKTKEPACSQEEKKGEKVKDDETKQLTDNSVSSADKSSGMKEKDQSQIESKDEVEEKDIDGKLKDKPEQIQSVTDNETVTGGKNNAEQQSGCLVSAVDDSSTELKTDELQASTMMNTEDEPQHLNQSLAADADSGGSAQPASVQDEEKDDTGQNTAKHESDDETHTEQASTSSRHATEHKGRISEHSEKDTSLSGRRSRERSNTDRSRSLTADYRQQSTQRRSSLRTKRCSPKTEKSDIAETERHYHDDRGHDHSSDHVRHQDHSRRYLERPRIRHGFSALEDISSDEENVEYRDGGNHCCQFCSKKCKTISGLLQHLKSVAHEQVFKMFL